jgi:hypothetical protein
MVEVSEEAHAPPAIETGVPKPWCHLLILLTLWVWISSHRRLGLGESEPWEAELSAFERAHQDWLAWIRAIPADGLSQELVNPQNNQRSSALAFVLARLEHEVHHRAHISTYLRMSGEQWLSPYGKLP